MDVKWAFICHHDFKLSDVLYTYFIRSSNGVNSGNYSVIHTRKLLFMSPSFQFHNNYCNQMQTHNPGPVYSCLSTIVCPYIICNMYLHI